MEATVSQLLLNLQETCPSQHSFFNRYILNCTRESQHTHVTFPTRICATLSACRVSHRQHGHEHSAVFDPTNQNEKT